MDQSGAASPMCLQGTFIQLVHENGTWDQTAWRALFDSLRHLQIGHVIVQWTVYDRTAFYPSQHFDSLPALPLNTLLDLADRQGMRVTVGLSHDPAYWLRIEKPDKRAYLDERLRANMAAAAELLPLAAAHQSFAGWYISEEIDDLNWKRPEDQDALFSYLQQLSSYLRAMRPDADVGLSGFAHSRTPPSEVEAFWTALLRRAGAVRIVYFQDGIGVGKLDLDHLGRYYQAVGNAARSTGRAFRPVIEAFEQTSGAPISETEFAAAPAPLPRLLRQIEIAGRYAAHRVAFGVPEYLTPSGGEPAARLYRDYVGRMRASKARCPP